MASRVAQGAKAESPQSVGESKAGRRETRDLILEAARTCLVRDGYENITTRRIADEAGVNSAALHYHFGTKEALLAEAIRDATTQAEQVLRQAVEASPDAKEAMRAALSRTWEMVRERPGILRYEIVVRGFHDETARQNAIALYDVFRNLVQEILERHLASGGTLAGGWTTADLAGYIVAVCDGVVLQHSLTKDGSAARRGLALILTHILGLMGYQTNDDDPAQL